MVAFVQNLGRFTGLKQLELQADVGAGALENGFFADYHAVLRPALLRCLPPQLEVLQLKHFGRVGLEAEEEAVGEAGLNVAAPQAMASDAGASSSGSWGAVSASGAAAAAAPAELLPGVTQLRIGYCDDFTAETALRSLRQLSINACGWLAMHDQRLHLPQLTNLQLELARLRAPLRCAAMPALARLQIVECGYLDEFNGGPQVAAIGTDDTALQQLTHLDLYSADESAEADSIELLAGAARALRSLQFSAWGDEVAQQAARTLAAAGASQLTRLVRLCNFER